MIDCLPAFRHIESLPADDFRAPRRRAIGHRIHAHLSHFARRLRPHEMPLGLFYISAVMMLPTSKKARAA